ncbi:unnamed protein product [Staurois parvus]|uniref:Uncharacterized protein n=1 Tax=Staurois parvus TaxID=386267 RepID=A0ABN9HRF1_9NEOB|nr:unnamed protein product [Staurois parvus]
MHFPPPKKKFSSNKHQTEHVQFADPRICSITRWIGDSRRGGSKKTGSNSLFTQCGGLTP